MHNRVTLRVMSAPTHSPGRRATDTLAHRLLLIRVELGWSQRAAAEACGLTFGEWQSMEMGRRARGLDDKIRMIADVTGYDPVWIMWGGPLDRPKPAEAGPSADSGSPTQAKVAPLAEAA